MSQDHHTSRLSGIFRAIARGVRHIALLSLALVFSAGPAGILAQPARAAEVQEGVAEVLHEDRDVGSRYIYFLRTAAERLELRFAADPPALVSGDRIRVTGSRANGVLMAGSGRDVQVLAAAVLSNTFGAQPTLVILVNFQNNATQPYTTGAAQGVFNTTSDFDRNNSFQYTWLTGVVDAGQAVDVRGWYTILMDSPSTSCDYTNIATLAKNAATADGVVLSNYRHYVYAFPNSGGCTWWGLGSVGGNPSQAWINGSLQLRVAGHEMGHNFGLYHSHSLSCDSITCTASEYGDGWDIMGSSSGHFTAYQKERLGWLNYNDGTHVTPVITSVLATGDYQIGPYEAQDSTPKALKILKSTDPTTGKKTYYYVEFRNGLNNDSALSKAVIVHTGSESSTNNSYLWDLDQTTTTVDWILNVGQAYTDTAAAVTITLLSMDTTGTTGARVNVTFGPVPCVPANPVVSISPASPWVIGSSYNYTVAATNNDNSGCATSTFSLAASPPLAPLSWAGVTLGQIAPGATGSTSVAVSAPAGTPDGYYPFTVTVTNTASGKAGSASATEVCCSGNLAVSVATSGTYTPNSWVTITVNVKVGSTNVSGAAVSAAVGPAGGSTTTVSGTADGSGNAALRYRLGPKATGPYQVNATASMNGYQGNRNNLAAFTASK